jgi:hypothetical protein
MSDTLLVLAVAAVLGLAAYAVARARRTRALAVPSPILPARELQERYGLYAENRPTIRLDPLRVPAGLRDLVPLAETWGIGDDIIRLDFEEKASPEAKRELLAAVGGRVDQVEEWLRSQPEGGLSEEAAAFLYLLSAWAEVRPVEEG